MPTDSTPSNVTTRGRLRRTHADKENQANPSPEALTRRKGTKEKDSAESLRAEVLCFRTAAKASSQAAFFTKELIECVVEASLAMANGGSVSLLLEEKGNEILKACRTAVKEATEQKGSPYELLHWLHVGIHGLRALIQRLSDSKRDSALKILYHAIATAGRLGSIAHDETIARKAYCLAFLAYEAFGFLLRCGFTVSAPKDDLKIAFELFEKSCDYGCAFPVPADPAKGTASSKLPFDEVATMSVQSTLSIARIVTEFCTRKGLLEAKVADCQTWGHPLLMNMSTSHEMTDFANCGTIIVRQLAFRWIHACCRFSSPAAQNDVVAYCKQGYRALWDLASKFPDDTDNATYCLFVRSNAIQILLLTESGSNQSNTLRIRDALLSKHYEIACNSAWKATAAFVHQVADTYELESFHLRIGSMLDTASLIVESDSLAYFEYCAYRARQLITLSQNACKHDDSCIYSRLPVLFAHRDCKPIHNEAALACVMLAICVRKHLEGQGLMGIEKLVSLVEPAICSFDVWLRCASGVDAIRLYKLFFLVSLPRIAFDAVEATDDATSPFGSALLKATGDILSRCYYPLAKLICEDRTFGDRRSSHADNCLDALLRAIAVYEQVKSDDAPFNTEHENANAVIDVLVDTLSDSINQNQWDAKALERAARMLSHVGRSRFERSMPQQAIAPLLDALRLWTRISNSTKEANAQLAVRWSYLASIYHSLDLKDEFCIAAATALAYDTRNFTMEVASDVDSTDTLLHSLISNTNPSALLHWGTHPTSRNRRSSLVARLVGILCDDKSKRIGNISRKSKVNSFTAALARDGLRLAVGGTIPIADSFEKCIGVGLGLDGVVQAILCQTSPDDRMCRNQILGAIVLLLVDVLEKVGTLLQEEKSRVLERDGLASYKKITKVAVSFVKKMTCNTEAAPHVLEAIIYALASLHLVTKDSSTQFDTWCLAEGRHVANGQSYQSKIRSVACHFASNAVAQLKVSQCETNWSAVTSVLTSSLLMFSMQLVSTGNDPPFLRNLYSSLETAVRLVREKNEMAVPSWVSTQLAIVLSKCSDHASHAGEKFWGARLAFWAKQASEHTVLETKWLSFLGSSLPQFQRIITTRNETTSLPSVLLLELVARQLYVKTLSADPRCSSECLHIFGQLNDLARKLGNLRTCDTHPALAAWTKGSIALARATLANRCGAIEKALRLLDTCILACTQSLRWQEKATGRTAEAYVTLSSISIRCRERQIDCLRTMSTLYASMGNYRSAERRATAAVELAEPSLAGTLTKAKLSDCLQQFAKHSAPSCYALRVRRTLHTLKAEATTADNSELFVGRTPSRVAPRWLSQWKDLAKNVAVERILDEIALSTLNIDAPVKLRNKFFRSDFVDSAKRLTGDLSAINDEDGVVYGVESTESRSEGCICSSLLWEAELDAARATLLHADHANLIMDSSSLRACRKISQAPEAPILCRASSLYLLGLSELKIVRTTGLLNVLWSGCSRRACRGSQEGALELQKAEEYFTEALLLLHGRSDLLTRNIKRSLALAIGPGSCAQSSQRTCFLIHSSIGEASRRRLRDGIGDPAMSFDDEATEAPDDVLAALDLQDTANDSNFATLLRSLEVNAPRDWRFVAAALCPTGEMLMSTIAIDDVGRKVALRNICILPEADEGGNYSRSIYEAIVKPLDTLVSRSQAQLNGGSNEFNNCDHNEDAYKREWWVDRQQTDEALSDLLKRIEHEYFQSEACTAVLCGDRDMIGLSRQSLASRFEALSVDEVASREPDGSNDCGGSPWHLASSGFCTFFVLDEHLCRFPFESLPIMEGRTACRLPSLLYAAKILRDFEACECPPAINPSHVKYVLDPESNLHGTHERMTTFLESIAGGQGCSWESVVGTTPPVEFIERCLTTEQGLLLYFGHGGGQNYISRSKLESLAVTSIGDLHKTKASVVLMGCSSAQLVSVNQKDSRTLEQLQLRYEPEGITLSYLLAGSPCVIGNLWDVTDRDIDRFSQDMLGRFFAGEGSLAQCVASARAACKLKHIVGCAPVCYGIPVELLQHP